MNITDRLEEAIINARIATQVSGAPRLVTLTEEDVSGVLAALGPEGDSGLQHELEVAVRERTTAEAQLSRVATHCRQRLDMAIVQGPVSDLCREILAIIGSET